MKTEVMGMGNNQQYETDLDDREFTDEQLRTALQQVGRTAREEAFRAGLPVVALKDGHLVWIYSDGREETVDPSTTNSVPGDGR
jgi:hypothetical protein